ncbi:unnamed protein product (macronuclear) [Paramecium tetraurelia]|uniref:Response regulatory domain-containing protein n=1 Tax=Paramecium tetraurelia TaxID=5888 RepID=A0CES3_PARTE|nr:uncharacterized protein GSPATT00037729001 [Paramecium tetraurelia]CAK69290.1 unnamed protein product [Paramecium tetraurelia]|eukprot:XP_001436687.1 hypothetical protein (macronuclear) [Paramecium tetraurelia strain d4-2]
MIKSRIKFHSMLGVQSISTFPSQFGFPCCSQYKLSAQLVLIARFNKFDLSSYFILIYYSVFQLLHFGTQSIWFLLCLIEINQTEKQKIHLFNKILQVTTSIIVYSLSYRGNTEYSEFQSIIYCLAFLFYQLLKDVGQFSKFEVAENEILQELKKQIIIKIFDQNYQDITPNNSPQLESNPYVLMTQNTQMDDNQQFYIKCYSDKDFAGSPDQNQNNNKQIVFQDCISLLKFINNQDSFVSSEQNHFIASSIDMQKNTKQKFRVMHKRVSLGNTQILAFWKIDSFTVKQTKQKFSQFKKQFTDLFAHKLKTPLNATLGFLSSAYNSADVDSNTKSHFIKPAYINSKLQYFQISDLLEFLSPQIDKITIQQTKINMRTFLLSLTELIESQCINKRILFQVFVEQVPLQQIDNFYINSDDLKLERVLYNILNQSYRHTPSGGQITLSLSINKENTEMDFVIDGSGCGFSDEDIENINMWIKSQSDFNFKKKHLVIKKELRMSLEITNNLINILSSQEQNLEVAQSEMGTEFKFKINIKENKATESLQEIQSVGLMLKQRSVRNMKSSQNNNGMAKSIFSSPDPQLQLNSQTVLDEPRAKQPLTNKVKFGKWQKQHKELKRARSSLLNKNLMDTDKSILIVDDEPFNHDTLILMMKSMGYKYFLKAFNGQQAIDMVQQNEFDICLILMDLDMPIMGGIEATKILVQMMIDLELAYIPIIGCTAHDDKETLEQCTEVGMLHVVLKPVFVKTLREAFQYIVFSEEVKKRSQYLLPSQLQI